MQLSLYSVLKGEQYWKDPEVFNPERFLDTSGNVQVPEAFIPFGVGELAQMSVRVKNWSDLKFSCRKTAMCWRKAGHFEQFCLFGKPFAKFHVSVRPLTIYVRIRRLCSLLSFFQL